MIRKTTFVLLALGILFMASLSGRVYAASPGGSGGSATTTAAPQFSSACTFHEDKVHFSCTFTEEVFSYLLPHTVGTGFIVLCETTCTHNDARTWSDVVQFTSTTGYFFSDNEAQLQSNFCDETQGVDACVSTQQAGGFTLNEGPTGVVTYCADGINPNAAEADCTNNFYTFVSDPSPDNATSVPQFGAPAMVVAAVGLLAVLMLRTVRLSKLKTVP